MRHPIKVRVPVQTMSSSQRQLLELLRAEGIPVRGTERFEGLESGRIVAQVSVASGDYLYAWYPDE